MEKYKNPWKHPIIDANCSTQFFNLPFNDLLVSQYVEAPAHAAIPMTLEHSFLSFNKRDIVYVHIIL